MRYDVPMKTMARALEISSSYLSGIEYGTRTLADKYVEGAIKFFRSVATETELENLRKAAEGSKSAVDVSALRPDKRGLVAAFARRLEAGLQPSAELHDLLLGKTEEKKTDDHR
jgi:hypothetical protein